MKTLLYSTLDSLVSLHSFVISSLAFLTLDCRSIDLYVSTDGFTNSASEARLI